MRLIDADALEKDANEDLLNYPDTVEEVYWNDGAKSIIDLIKTAPTIDPVKHGKWIDVMTEEWCTFDECKCSVCGVVEYFNKGWKKFSYCPNCGAKMEMRGE